jgi:phosphoribosyl 1,2-cyclic phosphate phosphodiesterase
MWIHGGSHSIVIDVGPDFRQQMLSHDVDHLDAVFLTHEHNDHVIGLDDLRPFIFRSRKPMKIYGEGRVLKEVRERFDYAFHDHAYPGAPSFDLIEIYPDQEIIVGNIHVQVIRTYHGGLPILSFRVGDLAYLTDVSMVPEDSLDALGDLEVLLVDCLRKERHHSHFNLQDATELVRQVQPSNTYLIHISHMMGPTKAWEKLLPEKVYPSFDGQRFTL